MSEIFTEIPELTAIMRATIYVQKANLEAANRNYALEAQQKAVVSDQIARKRAAAEENLGNLNFTLALLGHVEKLEAAIRAATDDWQNDMSGWVKVRGEAFDELLKLRYVQVEEPDKEAT